MIFDKCGPRNCQSFGLRYHVTQSYFVNLVTLDDLYRLPSGDLPSHGHVNVVLGLSLLSHLVDHGEDLPSLVGPQEALRAVGDDLLVGLEGVIGRYVFNLLRSLFQHLFSPLSVSVCRNLLGLLLLQVEIFQSFLLLIL